MMPRNDTASSQYNISGNPSEMLYIDAGQTTLVNKIGITNLAELQQAEEESLAKAYGELFREVRTDTPITCELLRHIHTRIFGNLYEWAGRWRTVQMSKDETTWPPPNFLNEIMEEFEQNVLAAYPAASSGDDEEFCRAAGHIQGEFLAIHPFREGNARTIKCATNILATQTDRPPLLYDDSAEGKARYIEAAKAAILKNYDPMAALIEKALSEARKAS